MFVLGMSCNVVCGLSGSTKFFYIENMLRFSLTHLSETFQFLILRRNDRDVIKYVYWSSREVPLFLPDFNELGRCRQSLETYSVLNLTKIRPAELSFSMRTNGRTDWQADMKKLVVAFRNFVNAPENNCFVVPCVCLAQQCAQKSEWCLGWPQKWSTEMKY